MNRKILLSFLLVVLIALSASAVSAADAQVDDVAAAPVDETPIAEDSQVIVVDGDTDVDIQNAIDDAKDNYTIDLGNDKTYNLKDTVTVNKKLTIIGNNVTLLGNASGTDPSSRPDNGYIYVVKAGSGTIITGLTLKNVGEYVNLHYTGEDTLQGWGIYIRQATNCIVDNCTFWDWNHAVRIQQQANNNIVKNSFFYGGTATFINNLPNGPKDRGTYYIGIMGSSNNLVTNNVFDGPACDAVSIASGSGGNNVIGNYFKDNAYCIYFGGDSTKNTILANNTFVNCGSFESDIYNATTSAVIGHVKFIDLPVISVQKSADGFQIIGNTFYANTANILIAAQEGNTAHGYPSTIGNFIITQNTIEPNTLDAVLETVVLCKIESNIGTLNPTGRMQIINNTLNGAKSATYWSNDWGYNTGDIDIAPADKVKTFITINSLSYAALVATLTDINGKLLSGETIDYAIGGVSGSTETDANGVFTINIPNGFVNVTFGGTDVLAEANLILDTDFGPAPNATVIAVDSVSKDMLIGSLTDVYGNPLADQFITYYVDAVEGNTTTDEYGSFVIANPNGLIVIDFAGIEKYASATTEINFVLPVRKASEIVVDAEFTRVAVDYNAGERGQMFYFTLKDGDGNLLVNKTVQIGINGPIYTVKTNEKGQAGLQVNMGSANTYTYAISYLGDDEYNASFAVSKLKVTKKPLSIIPKKTSYTFTASAKTKTVEATLKTSNSYLKEGKKVTLTVNGKTYTATAGKNGAIKFNIGALTKKGTYTVYIKYAGDNTYDSATSKPIKIVVK